MLLLADKKARVIYKPSFVSFYLVNIRLFQGWSNDFARIYCMHSTNLFFISYPRFSFFFSTLNEFCLLLPIMPLSLSLREDISKFFSPFLRAPPILKNYILCFLKYGKILMEQDLKIMILINNWFRSCTLLKIFFFVDITTYSIFFSIRLLNTYSWSRYWKTKPEGWNNKNHRAKDHNYNAPYI